MSATEALEFRIAKLELNPGDVVILKFDCVLTHGAVTDIRESLKRAVPDGNKMIILDRGCELSVLTKAEIEARAV